MSSDKRLQALERGLRQWLRVRHGSGWDLSGLTDDELRELRFAIDAGAQDEAEAIVTAIVADGRLALPAGLQ